MATSINQISKEVCPSSTFLVRREVEVDGHKITIEMVPTSQAADTLRQNSMFFASKLKELFRTGGGTTLREMLQPGGSEHEPMQEDAVPSAGRRPTTVRLNASVWPTGRHAIRELWRHGIAIVWRLHLCTGGGGGHQRGGHQVEDSY